MCVSYWKPGASQHLALRAASWHLAMFGDQNLLSQQIHSKVKIQSKVELQNAIFTVSKLPIFPITSLPFEFSFLLSETFSSWKILIVKGATSNLSYASVISPFHLKKSSYYLSLGKEKNSPHFLNKKSLTAMPCQCGHRLFCEELEVVAYSSTQSIEGGWEIWSSLRGSIYVAVYHHNFYLF